MAETKLTFEAKSRSGFGLRPNQVRTTMEAQGGRDERGLRPNQETQTTPPPPPPSRD
jgi:hypothetical protein